MRETSNLKFATTWMSQSESRRRHDIMTSESDLSFSLSLSLSLARALSLSVTLSSCLFVFLSVDLSLYIFLSLSLSSARVVCHKNLLLDASRATFSAMYTMPFKFWRPAYTWHCGLSCVTVCLTKEKKGTGVTSKKGTDWKKHVPISRTCTVSLNLNQSTHNAPMFKSRTTVPMHLPETSNLKQHECHGLSPVVVSHNIMASESDLSFSLSLSHSVCLSLYLSRGLAVSLSFCLCLSVSLYLSRELSLFCTGGVSGLETAALYPEKLALGQPGRHFLCHVYHAFLLKFWRPALYMAFRGLSCVTVWNRKYKALN
jgi:hypothetical protein